MNIQTFHLYFCKQSGDLITNKPNTPLQAQVWNRDVNNYSLINCHLECDQLKCINQYLINCLEVMAIAPNLLNKTKQNDKNTEKNEKQKIKKKTEQRSQGLVESCY